MSSAKVPKLPTNSACAKICKTIMFIELKGVAHHLTAMTPEEFEKEIEEGRWPEFVKVLDYGRYISDSIAR